MREFDPEFMSGFDLINRYFNNARDEANKRQKEAEKLAKEKQAQKEAKEKELEALKKENEHLKKFKAEITHKVNNHNQAIDQDAPNTAKNNENAANQPDKPSAKAKPTVRYRLSGGDNMDIDGGLERAFSKVNLQEALMSGANKVLAEWNAQIKEQQNKQTQTQTILAEDNISLDGKQNPSQTQEKALTLDELNNPKFQPKTQAQRIAYLEHKVKNLNWIEAQDFALSNELTAQNGEFEARRLMQAVGANANNQDLVSEDKSLARLDQQSRQIEANLCAKGINPTGKIEPLKKRIKQEKAKSQTKTAQFNQAKSRADVRRIWLADEAKAGRTPNFSKSRSKQNDGMER